MPGSPSVGKTPKKSRIWETPTLSTDADSSIDFLVSAGVKKGAVSIFFASPPPLPPKGLFSRCQIVRPSVCPYIMPKVPPPVVKQVPATLGAVWDGSCCVIQGSTFSFGWIYCERESPPMQLVQVQGCRAWCRSSSLEVGTTVAFLGWEVRSPWVTVS